MALVIRYMQYIIYLSILAFHEGLILIFVVYLQYTRPTSDVKSLGEMIFGSVAMALRGSTFKVHVGGSPSVLMFTKVANSPSKKIRYLCSYIWKSSVIFNASESLC